VEAEVIVSTTSVTIKELLKKAPGRMDVVQNHNIIGHRLVFGSGLIKVFVVGIDAKVVQARELTELANGLGHHVVLDGKKFKRVSSDKTVGSYVLLLRLLGLSSMGGSGATAPRKSSVNRRPGSEGTVRRHR
jgi:hypothetical protein